MSEAYTCADNLNLVLADVNDPAQADVSLRLGEPERLAAPAFQIDRDDLLVVTNRESPLQNMSEDQVQNLFARPEDPAIQVWVFSQDEDIQQVFAREVMRGQIVTSLAHLALSPQQMSDTINHRQTARKYELVHDVRLTAGSLLAKIIAGQRLGVNSTHHQAVKEVAEPLTATAVSGDGVVEGLELKPRMAQWLPFCLSVQFHPERLAVWHREHLEIFRAFVAASALS